MAFIINDSYNIISCRISNVGISFTHTHRHTDNYIFSPLRQADRGCATEAVLCHGRGRSIIFCIIWYISLYLDRLLVVLIEGELLWGDSGITVAGFDVIPLHKR
jgi:hypothetical protein